ncbi:hypothetical protein BH20ACI2_BH20ACI2_23570 [soil metagenome]
MKFTLSSAVLLLFVQFGFSQNTNLRVPVLSPLAGIEQEPLRLCGIFF